MKNRTRFIFHVIIPAHYTFRTCDQYPHKLNSGHFFSSITLPLSAGEKKIFKKSKREIGNFLLCEMVVCILEVNSEEIRW